MDTTGRKDLSGRPAPFYPSARAKDGLRTQVSAAKTPAAAPPPKNPAQVK
jgi:hypothetical protein